MIDKSVAVFWSKDRSVFIQGDGTVTPGCEDFSKPAALRGIVPRVDPLSATTFSAIQSLVAGLDTDAALEHLPMRLWSRKGNLTFRREFVTKLSRGYVSANHYAGANPNALCSVTAMGLRLPGGHAILSGRQINLDLLAALCAGAARRACVSQSILGFCDYDDDALCCGGIFFLLNHERPQRFERPGLLSPEDAAPETRRLLAVESLNLPLALHLSHGNPG